MINKRLYTLVATLVLLSLTAILAGCAGGATKTYSAADAGKTLAVNVGDQITIVLESNESTGFVWSQADGTNAKIVEKVSNQYYASTSNTVGAPGEDTWIFQAMKTGQTKIKLNLGKPWETDVVPLKSLTYTIKVN